MKSKLNLKPLHAGLQNALSWVKNSNGMASFITGFCFIDCLSTFYFARNGNPDDYKEFVKRFSPKGYDAEAIYHCVRCGLIHNLTERTSGNQPGHDFREDCPQHHLKLRSVRGNPNRKLRVIDLSQFKNDTQTAVDSLFKVFDQNPELARRAVDRFKRVGLISGGVETV